MGILITVKNANFSANAIGFMPPVSNGLEYWNYFGDLADKTSRNMASDKDAGIVTGSPVVGDGFCTFESAVSFVQTTLLDQSSCTLLCAARAPQLGSATAFMVGSYASNEAGAVGSSIFFQNGTVHTAVGRRLDDETEQGTFISLAPDTIAPWSFYAVRIGETEQIAEDATRSLRSTENVAHPRGKPNGYAYRIGSSWSGLTGVLDIAFAAIYSRELSESELALVHERVRSYLATKNIPV